MKVTVSFCLGIGVVTTVFGFMMLAIQGFSGDFNPLNLMCLGLALLSFAVSMIAHWTEDKAWKAIRNITVSIFLIAGIINFAIGYAGLR